MSDWHRFEETYFPYVVAKPRKCHGTLTTLTVISGTSANTYMHMPPILIARTVLVVALLAITGCKSDVLRNSEPSGSLIEEPVQWSSQERAWLDGRTAKDFQALMLHLDSAESMGERKQHELRRELEKWPDEQRVTPEKWAMRIAEGKSVEMIEFARILSFRGPKIPRSDLYRRRKLGRSGLKTLVEQPGFRELLESEHLIGLDLSGTALEGDAISVLLERKELRGLTYLDLSANRLGPDGALAIAKCEHLTNLTWLELGATHIHDDVLAAITASKHLDGLRRLGLRKNLIYTAGVVALAASPSMSELVYLDLADNHFSYGVEALARSPHIKHLEHLDLSDNSISITGYNALAESQNFANLEYLDLSAIHFGDHGATQLAKADNLRKLKHLDLSDSGIGVEGVVALAKAKHIGQLEFLGLRCGRRTQWGESAGTKATSALAEARFLSGLEHLDLSACDFGSKGAEALASASFVPYLRRLDISGNYIGNEGLRVLLSAAERLEQLDVGANRIDADGLAAIVDQKSLRNLTDLNLAFNKIGDDGVSALTTSKQLQKLRRLNLRRTRISSAVVAKLVDSALMPKLHELVLTDNSIGDTGVEALATAGATRNLRVLDIGDANIGDRGAQAIAESKNLAGLVELGLDSNQIGDDGAIALAESEHMQDLERLNLMDNDKVGARGAAALQTSPHIECRAVLSPSHRVWCDGRVVPREYEKNVEMCKRGSASGCFGAGYAEMNGLRGKKQLEASISHFAKGCAMDDASSCNAHAWVRCHDLGECDKLAETNARKAIELLKSQQDAPYFLDTLAYILCQRGKEKQGNATYQRACEAKPDSEFCGKSCG